MVLIMIIYLKVCNVKKSKIYLKNLMTLLNNGYII